MLVTRPQPAAEATAVRLIDAGFKPVILPLTRIVPLPYEMDSSHEYDAVAITSANAIHHTRREDLQSVADRPLYAVGERSAEVAGEAGFGDVLFAEEGNAEGLVELILEQPNRLHSILYLTGRPRTGRLEIALETAGIKVTIEEVYAAEPMHYDRAAFRSALMGHETLSVMIYSVHAARILAEQAKAYDIAIARSDIRFCVISAPAGAPLEALSANVMVAERPHEDAMFELLPGGSKA